MGEGGGELNMHEITRENKFHAFGLLTWVRERKENNAVSN